MASGRHTGKIIVSIPAQRQHRSDRVTAAATTGQPDGGYIIVGGMGGLGFVVAQWLVAQGAGMVVLNGRSSPQRRDRRQ